MPRKLFIASDHGGYQLKESLKQQLHGKDLEIVDLGTDSEQSTDYPDYAHKLAKKVLRDKDAQGILVCGTGIGMSMAANRHPGIRAALVTNEFMAQMAKKHNNANVLVLGGRVVKSDEAKKLVDAWLNEKYEGGRHDGRLEKI